MKNNKFNLLFITCKNTLRETHAPRIFRLNGMFVEIHDYDVSQCNDNECFGLGATAAAAATAESELFVCEKKSISVNELSKVSKPCVLTFFVRIANATRTVSERFLSLWLGIADDIQCWRIQSSTCNQPG